MMNRATRTAYLDSISTNKTDGMAPIERKPHWCRSVLETVEHFYMQFLLVTTLYVMEPWERLLMITIFLLVISLVSYSAFVYIPIHFHHILQSTMPSLLDISMQ